MKFKNIITKKENIEYLPGDVLIGYNEILCDERAYMVIRKYGMYNLIDLNNGEAYYNVYRDYDNFAINLEERFSSAEIIRNHELELVRVED